MFPNSFVGTGVKAWLLVNEITRSHAGTLYRITNVGIDRLQFFNSEVALTSSSMAEHIGLSGEKKQIFEQWISTKLGGNVYGKIDEILEEEGLDKDNLEAALELARLAGKKSDSVVQNWANSPGRAIKIGG